MEYASLAHFTQKIWWWPAGLLLATVWFWRQSMRGHRSATGIVKVALMLNCAMTGYLYFSGNLASGFSGWLNLQPAGASAATHVMAFVFFLMALLWLLDAVLERTPLKLPGNAWAAMGVIALCTLGFLFPALEWAAGNPFPHAQSFGLGGVPLLIFSAALLGGSRPTTWLARGILSLMFLASWDAGLAAAVSGHHWHYGLAWVACGTGLGYAWSKSRFVELSSGK